MFCARMYTEKEIDTWKDIPPPFNEAPDWYWARVVKLRSKSSVTIDWKGESLDIHAIAFTSPMAGDFIRWDCISGFTQPCPEKTNCLEEEIAAKGVPHYSDIFADMEIAIKGAQHASDIFEAMETSAITERRDFHWALEQLSSGRKVARKLWDGDPLYIFSFLKDVYGIYRSIAISKESPIKVVNADRTIVTWPVTLLDLEATDWYVVE